jgi:hypothetical protein
MGTGPGTLPGAGRYRATTVTNREGKEDVMPLLFWWPYIIMAGMIELAGAQRTEAGRKPAPDEDEIDGLDVVSDGRFNRHPNWFTF